MSDRVVRDALIAATIATGGTSAVAQNLPPLPSHASGVECTADDGIDRTDRDFMRKKIDAAAASGELDKPGWKLAAGAYKIPYMASTHSNIEILDPKGKMFASIDTQNISREDGSISGYFPGKRYAPVVDDCMKGNGVVTDENRQARKELSTGTGYEALTGFAMIAERAVLLSNANFNYSALGADGKTSTNSNTSTRALGKVGGIDISPDFNKHSILGAPGLGVDLTTTMGFGHSRYGAVNDPKQIVTDPALYNKFLGDLEHLHPISQQIQSIEHGKSVVPQPVTP